MNTTTAEYHYGSGNGMPGNPRESRECRGSTTSEKEYYDSGDEWHAWKTCVRAHGKLGKMEDYYNSGVLLGQ